MHQRNFSIIKYQFFTSEIEHLWLMSSKTLPSNKTCRTGVNRPPSVQSSKHIHCFVTAEFFNFSKSKKFKKKSTNNLKITTKSVTKMNHKTKTLFVSTEKTVFFLSKYFCSSKSSNIPAVFVCWLSINWKQNMRICGRSNLKRKSTEKHKRCFRL